MDNSAEKERWFVAQIKPNSQGIALRNLVRQGFEVFAPEQTITKKSGSKFRSTKTLLFPGYIFVAFAPNEGHWRSINSTHGVSKLVKFGDAPVEVPADLILALQERCDEDGQWIPNDAIREGDKVRLASGPFAEFVAEVDQLGSEERAFVLIELMERQTRLEVSTRQLRRL